MAQKLVKVLASASSKIVPTVNVATSGAGLPTHTQTSTPVKGVHKTVQDSGGTVKGLKTIVIPGYVGPA